MNGQWLAERGRFLRSFLRSPRQVGAVLPTSRRTVRAMLDLATLERARCVVEMGAGTGAYTREILNRLGPDARLLAFEIDRTLADRLASELRDPRVRVLNDSAERAETYLGGERADVIVSAIPFTTVPATVRQTLLSTARTLLTDDGTMLVIQYSSFLQAELKRTFPSVRRRFTLLNVPPAFLFACSIRPTKD
jgi:phospholipid N-methyltransferase